MAIEYNPKQQFKILVDIAEDYTQWFARLALIVAYHEEAEIPEELSTPHSFSQWVKSEHGGAMIPPSVLAPVLEIEKSLSDVGGNILEMVRSASKPTYQEFVELKNLHSAFLTSIRRLEKDSAMETDGIDALTGMRPPSVLKKDLDKEMGRLDRNGSPFTLVLLRIDGFEKHSGSDTALQVVTKNVKQYLRPFDDSYYLGEGCFLLSLKHADMAGGEVVALRTQNSLESDEENLSDITISAALSEPVIGDQVFKLIDEMKADLSQNTDATNTVLKFLDVSPIEKFVLSKS